MRALTYVCNQGRDFIMPLMRMWSCGMIGECAYYVMKCTRERNFGGVALPDDGKDVVQQFIDFIYDSSVVEKFLSLNYEIAFTLFREFFNPNHTHRVQ